MSGFEGGTAPGVNGPRFARGGGVRKLRRNLKESVVGEVVREETTTHSQRLLGKNALFERLEFLEFWGGGGWAPAQVMKSHQKWAGS